MSTPASLRPAPRARRSAPCRALALALVLCNAAFGPAARAQPSLAANASAPPLLALDEALRLAQDRSRQLAGQAAAAAAAREMAVAAGQLPDPTLKAGLNNLPINGADRFSLTRDFMTMRSVGVAQEFTRDAKRQARTARFSREADLADAGRTAALANLQRDTALAWLDRHHQERLREVLHEQRTETALQVQAADAAYRGGRGAQADGFAARSAVAQLDDRIREAEAQLAMARSRLARWVGAAAERALDTPPDLGAVRWRVDDLETHLEHHPQLALIAGQEAVARAEADIAQSNRRADWSAELMFSQRGPAYSDMVSVNVSIPLQWDRPNRQDRDLAARLASVEQLRAQREEAVREHVAEARGWLEQWLGNRGRLEQHDRALLPLAAERTRATLAAYRGGGATLTAVLEARRAEIDARVERLRLAMDTARLWAQLEYLIPAGSSAGPMRRSDRQETVR